jgi:hypothetical protein
MSNQFAYPPVSDGKPFRLSMGLRELDIRNWIEGGPDLTAQLLDRNKLLNQNRDQVVQILPDHQLAIQYFTQKILDNLRNFHPNYEIDESNVTHRESSTTVDIKADIEFVQLAKVIAEDLCLLEYKNGMWQLVAAVVLFPSRWNLLEKIGKNLDQIHAPVPGYDQALQPVMTDTFNKIKPGRPVWRKNWSLHETSTLHEPFYKSSPVNVNNYWWRTERQTLTKSEDGKYILFTIRNRSEPFSWVKSDSHSARQFAKTLATLSPKMLRYKHLVEKRDEFIAYLNS